jgi:hypothetical protein
VYAPLSPAIDQNAKVDLVDRPKKQAVPIAEAAMTTPANG